MLLVVQQESLLLQQHDMAKKVKKRKTARPRKSPRAVVTPCEYLVEDFDKTLTIQEYRNKLNVFGSQGWDLLMISQYGTAPNMRTHLFKRVL